MPKLDLLKLVQDELKDELT